MLTFYRLMLFCSVFELELAKRYGAGPAYRSMLAQDVERWSKELYLYELNQGD